VAISCAAHLLHLALLAWAQGSPATDDPAPATRTRRPIGPRRAPAAQEADRKSAPPDLAWDYCRARYDHDHDGRITRAEYPRSGEVFARLDADHDGAVSQQDFVERDRAGWTEGKKEYYVAGGEARLGELAPRLELATTDGEPLDLARYRGRKPVVVIFGSLTCGPFRESAARLSDLARRYGESAQFLAIYVREAHAIDGALPPQLRGAKTAGTRDCTLLVEEPFTMEERVALAKRCKAEMKLDFPMGVDGLDDAANAAWAAWPERLYLVDLDGRLVYCGGPGPHGFQPKELELQLARGAKAWAHGLTLAELTKRKSLESAPSRRRPSRADDPAPPTAPAPAPPPAPGEPGKPPKSSGR